MERATLCQSTKAKSKAKMKGCRMTRSICPTSMHESYPSKSKDKNKVLQRVSTQASYDVSVNKDKRSRNQDKSKNLDMDPDKENKFAKTMKPKIKRTIDENRELKMLNRSLMNQNLELQKMLDCSSTKSKDGQKVHEIVLKIVSENLV